jgi:ABC-2 type transport system permease protein
MKIIGYIIQKEFKQIFRNKGMLPIIFVLPLLQLIILSNAATFEVKNIKFAYIDHDHTSTSRALVEKFSASTYFDVLTHFPSEGLASSAMLRGEVDVVLEIPRYFERDLQNEKHHTLGVTINAIDGAAAGVENVYVNQIIQGFNQHLKVDLLQPSNQVIQPLSIETIPLFWYNETLNYKTFRCNGHFGG